MSKTENLFIPARSLILDDTECYAYISKHLDGFFEELGVDADVIPASRREFIVLARECLSDDVYESRVHHLLDKLIPRDGIECALTRRATRVFQQLALHLQSGSTLDFGCGDGRVAELVHERQGGVTLADTYYHQRVGELHLPFIILPEEGICPLESNSFDNVVAVTVLHHCTNPTVTLKEMVRLTKPGGRLLIIESVYGYHSQAFDEEYAGTTAGHLLALPQDKQIAVTAFFDHLYNRCLFFSNEPTLKVTTPYNYLTSEGWTALLDQYGVAVEDTVPLGLDQKIAPLFHILIRAIKTRYE